MEVERGGIEKERDACTVRYMTEESRCFIRRVVYVLFPVYRPYCYYDGILVYKWVTKGWLEEGNWVGVGRGKEGYSGCGDAGVYEIERKRERES